MTFVHQHQFVTVNISTYSIEAYFEYARNWDTILHFCCSTSRAGEAVGTKWCVWNVCICVLNRLADCSLQSCNAMLCYAMLCYAMLCYAMMCHATLCYAMISYAMLCYATLCCAVLRFSVWIEYHFTRGQWASGPGRRAASTYQSFLSKAFVQFALVPECIDMFHCSTMMPQ